MIAGQNNLGTNVLGKKSGVLKKFLMLTESIGISEQTIKSISKTIVDTLSITELLNSQKLYYKLLVENIGIIETLNKGVVATLTENINVSETLGKGVSKILTELISITEVLLETVKRVAHSLYGSITKSIDSLYGRTKKDNKYHGIKKNNLSGKIKRL